MGEVPGVDEFAAAGLYDASSPHAVERLELLTWLAGLGITVEQMAANRDDLSALAGDLEQAGAVNLSLEDMAVRTGLALDQVVELHRASGLGPAPVDQPLFVEADVAVFDMVHAAAALFSWDELMLFLRVLGSSASRVANAANTLFVHDVEGPRRSAGASELELAQLNLEAAHLSRSVPALLSMYLRLHLMQATKQMRQAHVSGEHLLTVSMAVGFVDLVGYTARASTMSAVELNELVSRFEATASDVITDHGGRLVKLIGDEVMFVAVEPATGCAIAAALLRTFGADPTLTPRGGLAYGDVLARSGDYFGPTVNVASRIADQAVPGEILATPEAASPQEGIRLEPAGRRLLKGFDDPIALVSITTT